jgi:hypothetical protein
MRNGIDRGDEGMSRGCWSQLSVRENIESEGVPRDVHRVVPEPTPAEDPGVFAPQPLERWSPRDLLVGLARLVRWTGTAIVRGTATS